MLLGLGTSSNAGTAFALPAVVLLAVVAAAGAASLPWAHLRRGLLVLPVVALVALLLPSAPATAGGHPLWISGTPAREQVDQALGCRCRADRADDLNAAITAAVGTQRLLILRGDAVVNPESLRFFAGEQGRALDIVGPAADPLADLTGIDWVLAGGTAAPYFGVDLPAADARLSTLGTAVLDVRLSAANTVVLYRLP